MKFILTTVLCVFIPALFAQGPPTMPRMQQPGVAPPVPPAAPVADPNKVVLTVGDQKMTAGQYEELISALAPQVQATARGPGKRTFAERIVELMMLAQEAEKQKLDQNPKIKTEIAFQRENLLASAMAEVIQSTVKIDEPAVEKYYNEHKGEFEVLRARHILIRVKGAPMQAVPGKPELSDEEALTKAQGIRKRLLAGEDFATLAKAESDDSGSGGQGGDLGQFSRGMMVPPFEAAAFAAKVGDVTEPVKSPFGYHLIKVESHVTKSLAEARPDIEKKLRPALARDAVAAMRKNATVELDDSFFGPATPAVAPVGPAIVPPAGAR